MAWEAKQFATEDEAQRKRIEAFNSLFSFVYGLKNQVSDQEGSKLLDEDQKTILATYWVDECGSSASVEDLEEAKAEVQGVVNPITARLYSVGVAGSKDDV
jgi:heat shock protein 5